MKKLINYLFKFATSNKGVADVKSSPRHGFYGVTFRNLDWDKVKSNLSTIEGMLPPEWEANLSMAGDTYWSRGVQKEVKTSFLWISKDLREDQTQESVLADIPEELH
jgi:hypothetical protein